MTYIRKLHTSVIFKVFILIAVFIFTGFLAEGESKSENKYNVLVFYSFQPSTPWQDQLSAAFFDEIEKDDEINVEIISDYPWIKLNSDLKYEKLLTDFYNYKYSQQKIDIIVSTNTKSTNFLLKFGDIIFPGIPVVALPGPSAETLERVKRKPNWRAVFSEKKIRETIDLAVSLHPNLKNIAVISGTSHSGLILEEYCREVVLNHPHDLNPIYLTNMPMENIIEQVSGLPAHTAVIYLTTLMDSTGKEFIPAEILKQITASSNSPIYGLWETIIGSGIVGGYMVSPGLDGRSLAGVVLSTLKDGSLPSSKVSYAMSAYYFDWEQLKKWHIDVEDLPYGSVIENQEFSFWDLYKIEIIGAICIIILESLLIVTLLLQRLRLNKIRISLIASRQELEDKVCSRTEQLSLINLKLENEISEHKDAKLHIQQLLEGKETLLTEVHHRIKNNMMSLSSVLSLQSQANNNAEVSAILEDAVNRINSMMLLYDQLYRGTEYKNLPIKEYFISLLSEISLNFEDLNNIEIETDFEDFILDSDIVLKLGMIFNELITNSYKYGFPGEKSGKIKISACENEYNYIFTFSDNGIGFNHDVEDQSHTGFGLRLVQILTEQINGRLEINGVGGAEFIIKIQKK